MEEGWGKRGRKRDEEEEGAKKEMRERGRERKREEGQVEKRKGNEEREGKKRGTTTPKLTIFVSVSCFLWYRVVKQ